MGVGSIMLIGPISRSEDLSPHGLSEKVSMPFILHSQTSRFASTFGAIGAVTGRMCATGKVGAGAGAVVTSAAGNIWAAVWLCAGELFGANAFAQPTVIAIARVAIDSLPKIHGRRFLPLCMSSILVRYSYLSYKPPRRFTRNSLLRLKRPVTLETEEPCHGRSFCPSCGARRMVESAALLVDCPKRRCANGCCAFCLRNVLSLATNGHVSR